MREKQKGRWHGMSHRGRLLLVMLAVALATLLLCGTAAGLLVVAVGNVATQSQQETFEMYHGLIESYFYQTAYYNTQEVLRLYSEYYQLTLPPGADLAAQDWDALLAEARARYQNLVGIDGDSALFIMLDGALVAASPRRELAGLQAEIQAFLDVTVPQVLPEGAPTDLVALVNQLPESGALSSYEGPESMILAWMPAFESRLQVGVYAQLDYVTALEVLPQLHQQMQDESALKMSEVTGRYLLWAGVGLGVLVVVLVLVSSRLAAVVSNPIEREQLEQELARHRANEEQAALRRLNAMKTELLGNVSHELKTPLTVVSGYAQLAREELGDDEALRPAADMMQLAAAEADRLALMVGQVLDVARIEEGRMGCSLGPTRLEEVVHRTVGTHFPILNKNRNRLEIDLAHQLPLVRADAARLAQVLVNLIANAIRHTMDGLIKIQAAPVPGGVRLVVADDGEGMDEARLAGLFQRYGTGSEGAGGTGLGLYVCRYIVEQHGGSLEIDSKKGEGTTVSFALECWEAGGETPKPDGQQP